MAEGMRIGAQNDDLLGVIDDIDTGAFSFSAPRRRRKAKKARGNARRSRRAPRRGRKQRKSSPRSRKGGVRYTKNGQPYIILKSGKARFIKGKRSK